MNQPPSAAVVALNAPARRPLTARLPPMAPRIGSFAATLALTATVLAFNFIGDGLREALDPRLSD